MLGHRLTGERTNDACVSDDFECLLLSPPVLRGLTDAGFHRPSPIQAQALPLAKCGADLVCQAKSGTGKTCVFAVTALEAVDTNNSQLQVLVLAPTREIAHQIHDVVCTLGRHIKPTLQCVLLIGGLSVQEDQSKVKQHCHIAVATPGRVKSLIESKHLKTSTVRLFVLDEADKLLEKGSFQEQINWIYSTLPAHKQVLALSATYPEALASALSNYMNQPIHVRINTKELALIGIKQFYVSVKHHALANMLFDNKCNALFRCIENIPFQQCIVFSNYQARAENLCKVLNKKGWPSTFIAGGQAQTTRLKAMDELKSFKCRILITTDLSARGIDCDKVSMVINLDLPRDTATYLHRVGRAGRFGGHGIALTMVAAGDEVNRLARVSEEICHDICLLPDDLTLLESMDEHTQFKSISVYTHSKAKNNGATNHLVVHKNENDHKSTDELKSAAKKNEKLGKDVNNMFLEGAVKAVENLSNSVESFLLTENTLKESTIDNCEKGISKKETCHENNKNEPFDAKINKNDLVNDSYNKNENHDNNNPVDESNLSERKVPKHLSLFNKHRKRKAQIRQIAVKSNQNDADRSVEIESGNAYTVEAAKENEINNKTGKDSEESPQAESTCEISENIIIESQKPSNSIVKETEQMDGKLKNVGKEISGDCVLSSDKKPELFSENKPDPSSKTTSESCVKVPHKPKGFNPMGVCLNMLNLENRLENERQENEQHAMRQKHHNQHKEKQQCNTVIFTRKAPLIDTTKRRSDDSFSEDDVYGDCGEMNHTDYSHWRGTENSDDMSSYNFVREADGKNNNHGNKDDNENCYQIDDKTSDFKNDVENDFKNGDFGSEETDEELLQILNRSNSFDDDSCSTFEVTEESFESSEGDSPAEDCDSTPEDHFSEGDSLCDFAAVELFPRGDALKHSGNSHKGETLGVNGVFPDAKGDSFKHFPLSNPPNESSDSQSDSLEEDNSERDDDSSSEGDSSTDNFDSDSSIEEEGLSPEMGDVFVGDPDLNYVTTCLKNSSPTSWDQLRFVECFGQAYLDQIK